MSFDYDKIDIYWEDDLFIIYVGGDDYAYSISDYGDLLEGGLSNGVPFDEFGSNEENGNDFGFTDDNGYEEDEEDEEE